MGNEKVMIKTETLFADPLREVQANIGDWEQVVARLRAQLDVGGDGTDDERREATEELQVAHESLNRLMSSRTSECSAWRVQAASGDWHRPAVARGPPIIREIKAGSGVDSSRGSQPQHAPGDVGLPELTGLRMAHGYLPKPLCQLCASPFGGVVPIAFAKEAPVEFGHRLKSQTSYACDSQLSMARIRM